MIDSEKRKSHIRNRSTSHPQIPKFEKPAKSSKTSSNYSARENSGGEQLQENQNSSIISSSSKTNNNNPEQNSMFGKSSSSKGPRFYDFSTTQKGYSNLSMYKDMSTAEREKISLNRNSPYGSSLIPRSLRPYLLLVVIAFIGLYTLTKSNGDIQHEYGIMFDAGSTGSRIHVYKFHRDSNNNLILDDELFEQVKPGLSSYPDDIPGAVASIQHLVDSAKAYMDEEDYAKTPLALKASAGLRILGEEKSKPILEAVGKTLEESGFKQVWEPEIMGGDKEAVYSWVTLNYLAKVLVVWGRDFSLA